MLYKLMLCILYKNHLQVNAMQNTDQQKKRILKTILTDFSPKEKVITRYTRIYIKLNGWDNKKQVKSFIFIVVPQQKQYKCSSK